MYSDVFGARYCQVSSSFKCFFRSGILEVPEAYQPYPALTHGSVAWWPDVARTKQPARYGGRACDGNASQEEACLIPDPWIKRGLEIYRDLGKSDGTVMEKLKGCKIGLIKHPTGKQR